MYAVAAIKYLSNLDILHVNTAVTKSKRYNMLSGGKSKEFPVLYLLQKHVFQVTVLSY